MLKFNKIKDILGLNTKTLPKLIVEEPVLTKEQIDTNNAFLFLSENNQEKFSELISLGYKATSRLR